MRFSESKFSWIYVGVVWLALCNSVHSQSDNNLLQSGDQIQAAPDQPSFPVETFTGPGSSVESEATKPFNTVGTNPGQIATDAAAAASTTAQAVTDPTKIENQIPSPAVLPNPLPDQTPVNGQESAEKLPSPLPSNTELSNDAELSRLVQLLKAILSNPQFAMGGGLPLGPPPPGLGPMGDFGPFGSPGFMGGQRPPRFPGGGRRIARIIIMRKPRGPGGMMNMDGNFMGNN